MALAGGANVQLSTQGMRGRAGAIVVGLGLILTACAGGGAATVAPASTAVTPAGDVITPGEGGYSGLVLEHPVPLVDFTLTDQHGRPYGFADRAREASLTLLAFGYTHCPDICPGTMAQLAIALRELPPEVASKVEVVFVTVDPERDTPEVLREWIAHFDEGFAALSGPDRKIVRLQRSLGIRPATREDLGGGQYAMNHWAAVLAFTPDGLAHVTFPFGMTVEQLRHDIEKLVRRGFVEQDGTG
jgi:protein SCO1/2